MNNREIADHPETLFDQDLAGAVVQYYTSPIPDLLNLFQQEADQDTRIRERERIGMEFGEGEEREWAEREDRRQERNPPPPPPPRMTVRDFSSPGPYQMSGGIRQPTTPNNFYIHPHFFGLVKGDQFMGKSSECPLEHLDRFMENCQGACINNVDPEIVYLSLFRHSLYGAAKSWFNDLSPNSLETWDQVVKEFLGKYYPPWKTATSRKNIAAFQQDPNESLSEARERFRYMLRRCPHHGYDAGLRVSFFYEGLNPISKQNLDSGVGGQVARIPLDEAENAIDEVCRYYSWEARPAQSLPSSNVQSSRLGEESNLRKLVQESVERALSKHNVKQVGAVEKGGSESIKAMMALHCENCGASDHIASVCGGNGNDGPSINAMYGGRPHGDWRHDERGPSGSNWRGDQPRPHVTWKDQNQGAWGSQDRPQWRPQQSQGQWSNPRQQQGYGEGDQGGYKSQGKMPYQPPHSREPALQLPPPPKTDPMEAIMQQLQRMSSQMEKNEKQMEKNERQMREEISSLKEHSKQQTKHQEMLEKQLAQVASERAMASRAPLPAQPHPNPQGGGSGGSHGVCAIQLRSGTHYEGPNLSEAHKSEEGVRSERMEEEKNEKETKEKKESEKRKDERKNEEDNEMEKKENEGEPQNECEGDHEEQNNGNEREKGKDERKKTKSVKPKPPSYDPKYEHPPPYPHRLVERKLGDKFSKFLEMMKGLQVNMPFLQAISQMPSYAKFLKDILSNKSKLEEAELVQLPLQVSAMVEKKMPKKYSDPGCYNLPIRIGDLDSIGALADLGAGVSLMPLCIAKKLNFEMVPSKKTIQLADRSIRVPDGQLIDIPIRVGTLVVPCDFIVMEMDPDPVTPLILGREALKTLGAMVNCRDNTITLEVADEKIVFEFSKSLKQPMVPKICMVGMEDRMLDDESWKMIHKGCEEGGELKKEDFEIVENPEEGMCCEDAPDGMEPGFPLHPW